MRGDWKLIKDIRRDAVSNKKGINGEYRRVHFERNYRARILSIDGTRCLDCEISEISQTDAQLVTQGSVAGLKEFFLVLSSVGQPAYRRCRLAWVEGERVGVVFLFKSSKDRAKESEIGSTSREVDP